MLISPQVIFVELQKTAGTHVNQLLIDLFRGRAVGKHNAPPPEVIDGPIPILGSVRNPWSWYVSLWTYGCGGAGELLQRMRSPEIWHKNPYLGALPGETPEQHAAYRRASAQRAREFYYADPNNEAAFREWLTVLLSPHFRRLVEPAFKASAATSVVGALTYRYFKLFVRHTHALDERVQTLDSLLRMDEEHCFVNAMIRSERLEQDFIDAMAGMGCALSNEQCEMVLGRGKSNASKRPKRTADYYDARTAALVASNEQFIIRKFGYVSPLEADSQTFEPMVVCMRGKVPYDGSPERVELARQLRRGVRAAEGSGVHGARVHGGEHAHHPE